MPRQRKKILIIDDDKSILEALSLLLKSENYEVKTISNWKQVSSAALSYMPDLILLDILLSGGDGREIAQKIKIDKNLSTIPIIAISAQPNIQPTLAQFGADDFIAKPFDTHELFLKIKHWTKTT